MALSGLIDSISPVVNLIAQLRGVNGANKAITRNNVAPPAEKESHALYAALSDPNSPIFQKLLAAQKGQNLNDFQSQIREMQLADRRAGQMGRSPTFFNPERADEAVSFLTSRGLPQINNIAEQQTMNRILASANGIGGQAPAQANRQGINMQRGVSNATSNSMIPQQIMNILSSLGKTPSNQKVYQ